MDEKHKAKKRLYEAGASIQFAVDCFGDHLAKREKYKAVDGLDAVHFYLMQKHGWIPSQVRTMSYDDLEFALREEMQGWTLPKAARA